MRFGTGFGTIGPDSGYAKSLVNSRSFDLVEGERAGNTKVALAAIASARAALFGRAPTAQDVDLAIVLLGLEPDLPETVRADLGAKRVGWFAAVAHHPAKLYDFVSSLDPEVLQLTAAEAQARMTQGTSLITHRRRDQNEDR